MASDRWLAAVCKLLTADARPEKDRNESSGRELRDLLTSTQRTKKEGLTMWFSLFTLASGAAICLSVAAIVMQPAAGGTYRG
jgi:hypothetical protein